MLSKTRLHPKKTGFTLVELTVSMGVLALIVGLTAGVLISVVRSYQKQRVIAEIERNGDFVIRTLEESLRGANGISCIQFDGTVVPPEANGVTNCNLGTQGITGRVLVIEAINPIYIGSGHDNGTNTMASCDPAFNCFSYLIYSINDIDSSTGNLLTPETIRTNNSTVNGVNLSKFDVSISGGGTTGAPYNITVTIDMKGPVSSSLFRDETRTFQSFLTLRGSYL